MAKKRSESSDADKAINKFIKNLGKNYSLDQKEASLLKAFLKTNGNLSKACPAACISRKTFYNWLEVKPDFKEAFRECREYRYDCAEETLGSASVMDWKAAKALLEVGRPHGFNEDLVLEKARKQLPGGQGHVPLPRAVMSADDTPARVKEAEAAAKKTSKNGTEDK